MVKRILKAILLRRKNVFVDFKSHVSLNAQSHKTPVIISNSKLNRTVYGEGCKISDCYCYGRIQLGRFVSISGPGTVLSSINSKITIGSFTSIGQNVIIQDSYHRFDKISTYFMSRNIFNKGIDNDVFSKGNVNIGEDVWVGSNSVILSGVSIGRGSIIGAGCIVTKNVEPYSIFVGNPGRIIKKRFTHEIIAFLEELAWWDWPIEKIILNEQLMMVNLNKSNISTLNVIKKG